MSLILPLQTATKSYHQTDLQAAHAAEVEQSTTSLFRAEPVPTVTFANQKCTPTYLADFGQREHTSAALVRATQPNPALPYHLVTIAVCPLTR